MRKFPCGCCGGKGVVHKGTSHERVCPFCLGSGFNYIDDDYNNGEDSDNQFTTHT